MFILALMIFIMMVLFKSFEITKIQLENASTATIDKDLKKAFLLPLGHDSRDETDLRASETASPDKDLIINDSVETKVYTAKQMQQYVDQALDKECNSDIDSPDDSAIFPSRPLFMKELQLCDEKKMIMLKTSMACPNDTSCLACSSQQFGDRFKKIKRGFNNPALRAQRLEVLQKVIKNQPNERIPVVTMFASNYGQLYFLYNWACVLYLRHNIDVRKFTIVIPTDELAGKSLEERGFYVHPYTWINSTYMIRKHYSGSAEFSSALIASKHLMIMSINEYLPHNVTIFFQDVDIVWNKDPRPFLKNFSCRQDIIGMIANRVDAQGFVNGGMFYVRPTKKSQIFFKTLENIMIWETDDQTAFNALLRHHWFSELSWKVTPRKRFQNRVASSSNNETKESIKKESLLIHAISTPKESQFKIIDRWDYSKDKCPLFFDPNIKTVK